VLVRAATPGAPDVRGLRPPQPLAGGRPGRASRFTGLLPRRLRRGRAGSGMAARPNAPEGPGVVEVEAGSSPAPTSQAKPSRPGPTGARSFVQRGAPPRPVGPGPFPDGWDDGTGNDPTDGTVGEVAPRTMRVLATRPGTLPERFLCRSGRQSA
jgi:hypothetical protein